MTRRLAAAATSAREISGLTSRFQESDRVWVVVTNAAFLGNYIPAIMPNDTDNVNLKPGNP
jgi:hypothetical protein